MRWGSVVSVFGKWNWPAKYFYRKNKFTQQVKQTIVYTVRFACKEKEFGILCCTRKYPNAQQSGWHVPTERVGTCDPLYCGKKNFAAAQRGVKVFNASFFSEYFAYKLRKTSNSFSCSCYLWTKSYSPCEVLRCGRLVTLAIAGNVLRSQRVHWSHCQVKSYALSCKINLLVSYNNKNKNNNVYSIHEETYKNKLNCKPISKDTASPDWT